MRHPTQLSVGAIPLVSSPRGYLRVERSPRTTAIAIFFRTELGGVSGLHPSPNPTAERQAAEKVDGSVFLKQHTGKRRHDCPGRLNGHGSFTEQEKFARRLRDHGRRGNSRVLPVVAEGLPLGSVS